MEILIAAVVVAGAAISCLLIFGSKPMPSRNREPEGWISWYRDARPYMDKKQYLSKSDFFEGYIYVPQREKAFVFTSYEDAKLATPVYDGSSNMENRAGVERA